MTETDRVEPGVVDGLVERLRARRENVYDFATQGAEWQEDALCIEAADALLALKAEVEELRSTVVAFAGPWAVTYAKDYGLADGELHPTHYEILAKAGARMDDFRRAILSGESVK